MSVWRILPRPKCAKHEKPDRVSALPQASGLASGTLFSQFRLKYCKKERFR